MHGETVVVRAFGGVPLIRKVWEVGEDVVYLVSDNHYNLLTKEDPRAIGPIGFPKEDVFLYEPEIVKLNKKTIPRWEKLRPAF